MTRKAISTDTAPAALGPYSQAIVAGGFVFCSGTAGIDPATGLPGDGIEVQTELALRNLDAILTAAGASLPALVKTTIFYTNVEDFPASNAVYARFMPDPPPARSAPPCGRPPRIVQSSRTRYCARCPTGSRRPASSPRPSTEQTTHMHVPRAQNCMI
jgi:2-iminobutanoate/2-iminopropanoate deaminase